MLERGDRVPHFDVTTLDGGRARYNEVWQRKNLLLVSISDAEASESSGYVARLSAGRPALTAHDTALVVTTDHVDGVPRPGIVIADRWGEIHFVAHAPAAAGLPDPDELTGWLRYVQQQCPECEGEAR